MKITQLETFLIAPRWLFLRVHTDEGIVGLGEPYLEGRATTSAEAVRELEDYLIGQDPLRIIHHWEAMYRQPCYHGGAIIIRSSRRGRMSCRGPATGTGSAWTINAVSDEPTTIKRRAEAAVQDLDGTCPWERDDR